MSLANEATQEVASFASFFLLYIINLIIKNLKKYCTINILIYYTKRVPKRLSIKKHPF
mgnify:CR=1 FL=1